LDDFFTVSAARYGGIPRGIPRDTAGYWERYREIREIRDTGRYRGITLEILVDTERYGKNGEIRGDRGEYAEIEGDTGR